MKSDELREKYLQFFESKGHVRKPSDVLVPFGDESVLFTPAGMNQFKDHFLGKVRLDFTRATTCQKCLRTGDIDNVGRTPRHHTFFEMLGNFSFGDYFKHEAINWAWEFLTHKAWLGINPDRLKVSIYLDDDEAAEIWANSIGLPSQRIERMGEDDNFWPASAPSQGPDGVCGPCSEIFYINDDGSDLEIWNLVFTQFNRIGGPPNNLQPLPSKNIDTGMGLERTAAVLQGVPTNYHIDILYPIVLAAAEVCGVKYEFESDNGRRLRRIADHIRACTFAIHENVEPGKQKQNYVIRRLLRRAVLDGHQMNMHEPFLCQLVPTVVSMMASAYPELRKTQTHVQHEVEREEETFFRTIDEAVRRIQESFSEIDGASNHVIPGERAGELYTTYGVPPELYEQLARDRGFGFDWSGYKEWMQKHGEISGGDKPVLFQTGPIEALKSSEKETIFTGYVGTSDEGTVRGIVHSNELHEVLCPDDTQDEVIVVLDRTPFYAESGGQVGDTGYLLGSGVKFEVTDTQKDSALILHIGRLIEGELKTGQTVHGEVNAKRRKGLQRAHSATHLLHHALQQHLGEHAQQRGSKVEADWLRFDFKNRDQITPTQLASIEREVTQRIAENANIQFDTLPIDDARKKGAMMLFGEKYPDMVRMVSIGSFSKELCGGTHARNTAEVERFEIVGEESVSAGTRRIVALTGEKALEHEQQTIASVNEICELLGVAPSAIAKEAERVLQAVRRLKKQIASGKKEEPQTLANTLIMSESTTDYIETREALRDTSRLLNVPMHETADRIRGLIDEMRHLQDELRHREQQEVPTADALIETAVQVGNAAVITATIAGGNPNLMRQLIDQIRKKTHPAAILLGAKITDEKSMLVAGLTKDLVEQGLSAGQWIKQVAPIVNGGGGGKPDMAQAGGKAPEKLPDAMQHALSTMREMLG